MEIRNKVVLITGASSGIGAGVARRLAKEGAKVALAARRKELLEGLAAEITAQGGQALPIQVDVTDHVAIQKMVERDRGEVRSSRRVGEQCRAGFSADVKDIDPAKLRLQVAVNLVGVDRVCAGRPETHAVSRFGSHYQCRFSGRIGGRAGQQCLLCDQVRCDRLQRLLAA